MSVVSSSVNSSQHNASVGTSSSIGETIQTSPDSTSHEDSGGQDMQDRDRRQGEDTQDGTLEESSAPDSQVGCEKTRKCQVLNVDLFAGF